MMDSFNKDVAVVIGLTTTRENQLINLSCDFNLKYKFLRRSWFFQQYMSVKKDLLLVCILKTNMKIYYK